MAHNRLTDALTNLQVHEVSTTDTSPSPIRCCPDSPRTNLKLCCPVFQKLCNLVPRSNLRIKHTITHHITTTGPPLDHLSLHISAGYLQNASKQPDKNISTCSNKASFVLPPAIGLLHFILLCPQSCDYS